jgi:hypothetical protein
MPRARHSARRMLSSINVETIAFGIGMSIALSAFFISPYLYRDDISRELSGEIGWMHSGRVLASLLYLLLSAGGGVFNHSPLSSILAVAIMAIAAQILTEAYCPSATTPSAYVIFASLASFNPFMLQVLSYKYDALPYSAAFLLSAAAIKHVSAFWPPNSRRTAEQVEVTSRPASADLIKSCFLLVSSGLFYPVALTWWLAGIPLLFFKSMATANQHAKPSAGSWALTSHYLTASSISLLFLKGVFEISPVGNYQREASTSLPISLEAYIHRAIELALSTMYFLAGPGLNPKFLLIWGAPLAIAAIAALFLIVNNVSKELSQGYWKSTLASCVMFLSLFLFSCGGISVVFSYESIYPRILAGSGLAPAVIATWAFSRLFRLLPCKERELCKLFPIFLALQSLAFASVYANALVNQNRYDDFIIRQAASQIKMRSKDNFVAYSYDSGIVPLSPHINPGIRKRYPILLDYRYLPRFPREGTTRTAMLLRLYGADVRELPKGVVPNRATEKKIYESGELLLYESSVKGIAIFRLAPREKISSGLF